MKIKQAILGLITALIVTAPVGVSYAQEPSPTPTPTPVPTGSIVIVQSATCTTRRFVECEKFTFHTNVASIPDFTLHAVRDNENDDAATFSGLRVGTYVVSQISAELPFQDLNCTNGQGRRNPPSVTRQGDRVAINLSAGEVVTCTWQNRAPPVPTATATAIIGSTATPLPLTPAPLPTSQPPVVFQPIIIERPQPEPTATQTPAVIIRPPATGSAGLLP